MKKTWDLTKSKKPIMEPEPADRVHAEEALLAIGHDIARLSDILVARENDPDYINLVEESELRMKDISFLAMTLNPDDEVDRRKFVELQGQFIERKRLTNEMRSVKAVVEDRERSQKSMRKRFATLLEKLSTKRKD